MVPVLGIPATIWSQVPGRQRVHIHADTQIHTKGKEVNFFKYLDSLLLHIYSIDSRKIVLSFTDRIPVRDLLCLFYIFSIMAIGLLFICNLLNTWMCGQTYIQAVFGDGQDGSPGKGFAASAVSQSSARETLIVSSTREPAAMNWPQTTVGTLVHRCNFCKHFLVL